MGVGRAIGLWVGVLGVLLLALPAGSDLIWECQGFQVEIILADPGTSSRYGSMVCPTDSLSLSNTSASGAHGIGDVSHASDGDSTEIHSMIDLDDPAGNAIFILLAVGYFLIDVDEETRINVDLDVEYLQGERGNITVVPYCEDPNVTVIGGGIGGTDFIFGPGGGVCEVIVETTVGSDQGGVYEAILTATATDVPEPRTRVLLLAGILGLVALQRRRAGLR